MSIDKDPVDFHDLPLVDRLELALRAPAPFFVTGEDAIQISALTSTNSKVVVSGRFVQLNGQVTPFEHIFTPSTDRETLLLLTKDLGDGWIVNVNVRPLATTVLYGQMWTRVQVVRGLGASAVVLATLCSGYVTNAQPIGFPGSPIRNSLDGPGVIRSVTGTDPIAGAEISETVPLGARWRLQSIRFALVTDATVANRLVTLIIDDGANELFRIASNTNQTASLTVFYVGASLGFQSGLSGMQTMDLPASGLVLIGGYRIRTSTGAIVAGDNFGAPQMLVEEWLQGT